MVRRWLSIAPLALALACGVDDAEKRAGQPCTRDSECIRPLACRAGVCFDTNAENDASAGVMAGDGGNVAVADAAPDALPE